MGHATVIAHASAFATPHAQAARGGGGGGGGGGGFFPIAAGGRAESGWAAA
jgi:hypothetical protein